MRYKEENSQLYIYFSKNSLQFAITNQRRQREFCSRTSITEKRRMNDISLLLESAGLKFAYYKNINILPDKPL